MIDLTGIAEEVDIFIKVFTKTGFVIEGNQSIVEAIYPEIEETCERYAIPCKMIVCDREQQKRIWVMPHRVKLNSLEVAKKFLLYFQDNYKVKLIESSLNLVKF